MLMETTKRSGAASLFVAFAVQLLGIPMQVLQQGLTHRKIEAKADEVT